MDDKAVEQFEGWGRAALLVALPFLCWSGFRLARAHTRWTTPTERARVVVTTAA